MTSTWKSTKVRKGMTAIRFSPNSNPEAKKKKERKKEKKKEKEKKKKKEKVKKNLSQFLNSWRWRSQNIKIPTERSTRHSFPKTKVKLLPKSKLRQNHSARCNYWPEPEVTTGRNINWSHGNSQSRCAYAHGQAKVNTTCKIQIWDALSKTKNLALP